MPPSPIVITILRGGVCTRVITFKIYSLNSFQVLLIIVTMLYITSLGLIHLRAANLEPLNNISSFPAPLPVPGNHYSILLFPWIWLLWILNISENIQWLSFSAWLILLIIMSSWSVCVVAKGSVSFFFVANTPYLLHPFLCSWTLRLWPCLGYCE